MKCPKCNMVQPQLRKPADLHETLWGGWTCGNCGAKMNRRGKLRKVQKENKSNKNVKE